MLMVVLLGFFFPEKLSYFLYMASNIYSEVEEKHSKIS